MEQTLIQTLSPRQRRKFLRLRSEVVVDGPRVRPLKRDFGGGLHQPSYDRDRPVVER